MLSPLQSRSIRSWIIFGALAFAAAVACGSIAVLYRQGRNAVDGLASTEARDAGLRAKARVDQLLRAAAMSADSAAHAFGATPPTDGDWNGLFARLVSAFEQRPELRHLGYTHAATGDTAVLSRSPGGEIRLFTCAVSAAGTRTVRGFRWVGGEFVHVSDTPEAGPDPRTVPSFTAAASGRPGWTSAYPYSGPDGGPSQAHVTYYLPILDSRGVLAGVWDASLDAQSLREFMRTLRTETGAFVFVATPLPGGQSSILADPLPGEAIGAAHRSAPSAPFDQLLGMEMRAAARGGAEGRTGGTLVLDPPEPPWSVTTLLPESPAAAAFGERQTLLATLVLVGTVGIAVFGSLLLSHALSRPVEILRAAVARARAGTYERPSLGPAPREIVELEQVFSSLVEALGERQRRLQRHIDNTPLGVIDWTVDGRIAGWNHSAELIFGWTQAEALARGAGLVFPDSEQAEFARNWQRMVAGHKSTRHYARNSTRDGREVDCEWYHTPLLAEDGAVVGVSSLILDVSGRVSAESLFQESEDRFQKTFRRGPVAQSIVRLSDDTFLDVNERWESVFRISRRQAVGRTAVDLGIWSLDAAERKRMMATLDKEGELREAEFRLVRGDGEPGIFLVSVTLIKLVADPAMLVSLVDITYRSRIEQEVRALNESLEKRVARRTAELGHANKQLKELDRLKSEFLATMSHELRTPLNSIIGFTSILRQGIAGPLNEEQARQIEMVLGSARHLHSLINDLLDLSRIEAGHMEIVPAPCSIAEVLAEVSRTLAPLVASKHISYTTNVSPDLGPITTDRKRIFQVFLNLASNAVKFTSQGGVVVEAHADAASGAIISVRDTGIGIRRDNLPSLFEAFRQVDGSARRAYEGTGLGLYLVRKLLGLIGGTIEVQSEWGRGSTFIVALPREIAAPPARPSAAGLFARASAGEQPTPPP